MRHVNWHFKFFVFWFVAFFISVVVAMATRNGIAVNISLTLLMLIGVVMVITTGKDAFLSISSKHWPTSEFFILNSRVSRSLNPGSGASTNYKAYFELGYKVMDRSYTLPCNIFNIPYHSSKEEAERYIQEVKDGKFGKAVRYNPASPDQAYVKPGLRLQHILAILIGLGFIFIPAGFIFGFMNV